MSRYRNAKEWGIDCKTIRKISLFILQYISPRVSLNVDLVSALLDLNRTDDAFSGLNHAFARAKAFDEFLDKLRKEGEQSYSSPVVSKLKSKSEEVYATKQLPEFFENVLLDKNDVYFKKLHDDPRFVSLVDHIKEELRQYRTIRRTRLDGSFCACYDVEIRFRSRNETQKPPVFLRFLSQNRHKNPSPIHAR